MRKLSLIVLSLASLGLVAALVYRYPPVQSQVGWRVDFALIYLRSLIEPVQAMPTALPRPQVITTNHTIVTPIPTATPIPSPTLAFTPTPQPSPTPIATASSLSAPRWERQDINNCGPAALAMYLRFYGWEGDQKTISELIKPYREDRNVNVEELAYYVRTRAGWLNFEYRVGGDLPLLKELIAAGIPVMIEESFYFDEAYWRGDDLWAAHYQLLTGYDDATQKFTAQDSFRGANLPITYDKLDKDWQAFNRVYIMIYLPHQEETVKSIVGQDWELDSNRQHALEIAQAETQTEPDNAFAWFNLGTNLTYFERYIEATDAYDKARQLGLPQRMLRYQFGPFIAYFHTGQIDDLLTLTNYALKITKNAEEALLWHGWAMYRTGKKNLAMQDFAQALANNPTYQDAQYALDFVQANP